MIWCIYALIDPESGRPRYVGYSNVPASRIAHHIQAGKYFKKTDKAKWIATVLERGLIPQLKILEVGNGDWEEAERRWIATLKEAGEELTNRTIGGGGTRGYALNTEEQALLRLPSQKERLRLVGLSNKGRTPGWSAKLQAFADSRRGVPRSPETRANISRGRKGKEISAAGRAKMAAKLRRPTPCPFCGQVLPVVKLNRHKPYCSERPPVLPWARGPQGERIGADTRVIHQAKHDSVDGQVRTMQLERQAEDIS